VDSDVHVDPNAHANPNVKPQRHAHIYAQPNGDADAYVVDGLFASAGWDDHAAGR